MKSALCQTGPIKARLSQSFRMFVIEFVAHARVRGRFKFRRLRPPQPLEAQSGDRAAFLFKPSLPRHSLKHTFSTNSGARLTVGNLSLGNCHKPSSFMD